MHTRSPLMAMLVVAVAVAAGPATSRSTDYYATDAATFLASDAAQRSIDVERVDHAVMAAAIFHETNRVRAEHKLPTLAHAPALDAASQLHADDMVAGNFFAHENPNDPKKRTPMDRAKLSGYAPRYIAENLATAFATRYEAGRTFYKVPGGISYEPDGKPLPPHTYASFARAVVDGWMRSPGHRKNILATEPTQLGAGAALQSERQHGVLWMFTCAQEFGDPMPASQRERSRTKP